MCRMTVPTECDLPINSDPPVKGALFTAHPMSVLFGGGRDCLPWVLSRFFRVSGGEDGSDFQFDTDAGWWFERDALFLHDVCAVPKSLLYEEEPVVKRLMRERMEDGYGVVGHLNERAVPGYRFYRRADCDHEYLAVGYDGAADAFTLLGYTASGRYEPTAVGATQLFEAMRTTGVPDLHLHFFKADPRREYRFDPEEARAGLRDYLASRGPDGKRRYGLRAVSNLRLCLDRAAGGREPVERRYFSTLREHKDCMRLRLEYLQANGVPEAGELTGEAEALVGRADRLLADCDRWNAAREEETIARMRNALDALLPRDAALFTALADRLGRT